MFGSPWLRSTLVLLCLVGCGQEGPTLDDEGVGGPPAPFVGGRTTVDLGGVWAVEEGDLGDVPPDRFGHEVPVPSLLNSAVPPFEDIGRTSPLREAFWFRRRFTLAAGAPVARLHLHKAKYGAAVWLNGVPLGSTERIYSLTEFDATDAIRPGEENTLLIRVGADRSSLPPERPAGFDFEKHRWLPGIWDDVALVLTGHVFVVRTKVEADLEASAARTFVTLRNASPEPRSVDVLLQVRDWRSGEAASAEASFPVGLEPFEERTFAQDLFIDEARLWSPQDPHLYIVATQVQGPAGALQDEHETRFGLRTTEWRGGDQPGFFLNGVRFPLRGSNLTLHRFFEDPDAGLLPWDREWLRTLLETHPKSLDWNVFRMTIGRAPNRWYDILDEAGILVADEFALWGVDIGGEIPTASWSADALEDEFVPWIQESWNHPSIAWWDAANESVVETAGEVVERVRGLDQTRAWENGGWRIPLLPDDPIEHHPYFFARPRFRPMDFDIESGLPPEFEGVPAGHPWVANEYGFLWIGPDGLPTPATEPVFRRLVGPEPWDPEEIREARAYLVGGMTEFLRARRGYAGVQHFVYLTHASPEGFLTADDFVDHRTLTFEPRWYEYARNAFAEVGIYLDTWRESYPPGEVSIPVVVLNDTVDERQVTVRILAVGPDGVTLARTDPIEQVLAPLSETFLELPLVAPVSGRFVLYAGLERDDGEQVWSRRKVGYEHPGVGIPDPPFDE